MKSGKNREALYRQQRRACMAPGRQRRVEQLGRRGRSCFEPYHMGRSIQSTTSGSTDQTAGCRCRHGSSARLRTFFFWITPDTFDRRSTGTRVGPVSADYSYPRCSPSLLGRALAQFGCLRQKRSGNAECLDAGPTDESLCRTTRFSHSSPECRSMRHAVV